jgi:hypothetical protein
MLSRALTPYEKWYTRAFISGQLGVELINPRVATEFADFVIKNVCGYRLRCDGENVIAINSPVPVATLPSSLNNARDIVQYTELVGRPNFSERLATIAIRDNLVAISVAHNVLDGVSFLRLLQGFERGQLKPQSTFPDAVDDLLKNELAAIELPSASNSGPDPLAVIPWSSPLRDSGDRPRMDWLMIELPPHTATCYNPKTEKFVGLTDVLWGATALVCHAIKPGQPGYGSTMWISLRDCLKRYDLGNLIAPLTVAPEKVSPEMSIGDFEKSFRRDFQEKMKKREWLYELKVMATTGAKTRSGSAFFDNSNVGYFPTTGPFVDAWTQESETAMYCNQAFPLCSVTLFGKENARLTLRLPFSPHVFTRSDAARAFKGVQHYVQHIRRNMKVGDAIREIREAID